MPGHGGVKPLLSSAIGCSRHPQRETDMKITVIGMGAVGTEVVGHLLNSGVATEIVVVDQAHAKA